MAPRYVVIITEEERTARLVAIEVAARTLCENVTHVGPFSIPAVDMCDLIQLRKALGVSS